MITSCGFLAQDSLIEEGVNKCVVYTEVRSTAADRLKRHVGWGVPEGIARPVQPGATLRQDYDRNHKKSFILPVE